jgi:hypothetical protein
VKKGYCVLPSEEVVAAFDDSSLPEEQFDCPLSERTTGLFFGEL